MDGAQMSNLSINHRPFNIMRSNKLLNRIIENLNMMHTDKDDHCTSKSAELFQNALTLPQIALDTNTILQTNMNKTLTTNVNMLQMSVLVVTHSPNNANRDNDNRSVT